MGTLSGLTVEAADPVNLAPFGTLLLGWDDTGGTVRVPGHDGCALTFVSESGPKTRKNRLHLDLASYSPEDQHAKVERVLALRARPCDVGQGTCRGWCSPIPRATDSASSDHAPGYTTTEALAAIVVDALDPAAQAEFWAGVTGAEVPGVIIGLRAPGGRGPWLDSCARANPGGGPTASARWWRRSLTRARARSGR